MYKNAKNYENHLNQVMWEKSFVRKILDFYPKKVKIENSSLKFLPVQRVGFVRELPVQNTGRTDPGKSLTSNENDKLDFSSMNKSSSYSY